MENSGQKRGFDNKGSEDMICLLRVAVNTAVNVNS
jgi:hypothetical protein